MIFQFVVNPFNFKFGAGDPFVYVLQHAHYDIVVTAVFFTELGQYDCQQTESTSNSSSENKAPPCIHSVIPSLLRATPSRALVFRHLLHNVDATAQTGVLPMRTQTTQRLLPTIANASDWLSP